MARPKKSVKRVNKKISRVPAALPTPITSSPRPSKQLHHVKSSFAIVGIGSSAGGVEALEEFFCHLPSAPGVAFVVVSHQHPTHSSLLPELLRRWTPLPVIEATDGLAVKPNTVYLPPPGSRLAILHAILHLMDTGDGIRPVLPIDYFLTSLAEDQQDMAVGIVLSGTGADGTLGIKAIKAGYGLTMAQDPLSAKYAGMPQNAIATNAVDFVRPASELGEQVCGFFRHRARTSLVQDFQADDKRDFNKILVYLRDRTGNDFSLYKDSTTLRRIERRMNIHQIDSLARYSQYVQSNAAEAEALFQELLIGVTSFFRDPSVFQALMNQGLPQLLDDKPDGYVVRAWVPTCSTGEEAYSIAILFNEYQKRHKRRLTVQVFGTDLDAEAIDKARHGLYPEGIANDVNPERLEQFFEREDNHYRVKSELRDRITFAPHNVLKDPPFTRLDLLSCRNFLIYLRPETQQWLIPLFHYALKPKGLLILGNAESVDGHTNLFTTVDRQKRIFFRTTVPGSLPVPDKRPTPSGDRSIAASVSSAHRPSYLVESVQTLLLDRFSPSAVFVNRQGQVVYVHGRTGDYLEPASGPASQQVVDMARPGLRQDLMAALQLAEKQGGTVVRKGLRLKTQGKVLRVTLSVTPLYKPDALEGLMLVVFETASIRNAGQSQSAEKREAPVSLEDHGLVLELEYTRQRLQRVNEELQMSNEEFKSANEELQSANEELQSTNEELETTKEELQSLNEELVTVNAQLQIKLDELADTNDDLKNLVNSTDVATVFLDNELRIKRFTPEANRVSKVISSDIGRPFTDIVSVVRYNGLMELARTVLQTLATKEQEVQALDGRWYLLRIIPYRTSMNLIDGLVLTYVDISAYKRAAQTMREAQLYAESIVDTVREPLLILNTDFRVVSANRSFYRVFAVERNDVERHPLDRILNGRFNHPELKTVLENILVKKTFVDDIEVETDLSSAGKSKWLVNARCFTPPEEQAPLILLAFEGASMDKLSGHRT